MKNWVGLAVVAVLLVIGWIGYDRPELFPNNIDVARLVYLLMALLLVTGAGFGFWRLRQDRGRALGGILFWAALIAAITFGYAFFN